MEYEEECTCVELEWSPIPDPACPIHGEKIELTKEQINYIGTWLEDHLTLRDIVNEEQEDYINLIKGAVDAYNGGANYETTKT